MSRRPPIIVSIQNASQSSISVKIGVLDPHGCLLRWIQTDGTRVNSAEDTPTESLLDWFWGMILPTRPRQSIDISVAPGAEGVVWSDTQWPPRIHVKSVGEDSISSKLLEDSTFVRWENGTLTIRPFDATNQYSH